jgi:hypothetical protein
MAIRSSIQSIDYQTLIKNTSIAERVGMTGTRSGQALLAMLSPTELASAFPEYYKRASPDVSGFISAQTKKKQGSAAAEPTAQRLPSRASAPGNYTTSAETAVVAESRWKSELARQTGVSLGADERASRQYSPTESAGERQRAIIREASRLGVSPIDLATVISYESAGSMNPDKMGPVDRRASATSAVAQGAQPRMMGLIQFGASEQLRYGIKPGMGFDAQMAAVGRFLKDRGFARWLEQNPNASEQEKRIALYSTINAGNPDRSNWGKKDAWMGGAPGTVADKANSMFGSRSGHFSRAQSLMQASFNAEEDTSNYRQQREEELPNLPNGIAPALLEEYNRMSPRQKKNFQEALGKLDQNPTTAIERMNQIYQQNPAVVDRAAAQGTSFNYTNVAFSDDRIRSGVSQLSQETQATLQRLDSFGLPVTVTSSYRSPEQNARTPGAARTSMHMSGNAVDVRTNGKSPEELQRTVQALKRAGFNKVLIENDHIHAEVHPGSDNFNISLRRGHNNPNINVDQARAAAETVTFREPIQQRPDIDRAQEQRQRMQTDQPVQESVAPAGPQPTDIPVERNVNAIPAMADGGSIEGVEDASNLTAIPMKSGRDDTLLMNQGEPVAKVNSEEKMTYDSQRNRVTVTPKDRANADDLTTKMEERQQEIKDAPVLNQPQLAPNKPIEQVAPYTPERDFVNPVVPTDAALNDSMRRVMTRNEFKEEGSHFSFGASNFST